MTPLPTLRQLSYLTALARRRSFSAAAEECLVSQSTLSAGIRELERLLGGDVVDRSSRGFALTALGEDVLARAQDLLARAEDLARAADTGGMALTGPVRLGVIPTIGPFLLPPVLPQVRKDYPGLQLYLREDLTAGLIGRLFAGELDLILMAFPYEADGVDHLDLGEDAFVFAATGDHPLHARAKLGVGDLAGESLLLLEDGHCLRDHALDACRLADLAAARPFEATSLLTLAHMAAGDVGATLLPEMAVRSGLAASAGLAVKEFTVPAPSRRIGLAWRKGSSRSRDAMALAPYLSRAL
ncbi:MAG: hydrogen peroxide-inducible genes activator [Pseudomonadota bacterium]